MRLSELGVVFMIATRERRAEDYARGRRTWKFGWADATSEVGHHLLNSLFDCVHVDEAFEIPARVVQNRHPLLRCQSTGCRDPAG